MMNTKKLRNTRSMTALVMFQLCIGLSCTNDESTDNDLDVITPTEEGTSDDDCTVANFVFVEQNGLVNIEFENAVFTQGWELQSGGNAFSGEGYMVWTGTQNFNTPGVGTATYAIAISNPGTYQFIWNSAVTIGNNGTDHNDTWLRFADASDFFGQREESSVFPRGSGKTPNPQGSSSEGWFKVNRSGSNLDFKWESLTNDNNGHDIFVTFDAPGTYTMEISARSSGHALDRFVLFNNSFSEDNAISNENERSTIDCN